MGHTVRIILTEDLPGRGYEGEVCTVKAGYARNYLIPGKKALYATPANFERVGISDPDLETAEEKRGRLAWDAEDEEGAEEVKAADLLRRYLGNKVLKIWRNVDESTKTVHPGMVDYKAVREKLSKQLKIDLDDTETVHLRAAPVLGLSDMEEIEVDKILKDVGGDDEEECSVQIRELGEFLAKITLSGGHTVPLKFVVLKR